MMTIDVNNKEIKEFGKELRKMHRSNFPLVVRGTLNDLAFDVKKNTLLQSADREFILRNPSFFKRYSGLKKAEGFDINSMQSEVGIIPQGNKAAEGLTKQEEGGSIRKRSIYLDTARISRSKMKKVKKSNYLGRGIVGGRSITNRNRKSNFVAMSFVAKRENKFLLLDNTLFNVENVSLGTKVNIKLTPVANIKSRTVRIEKRPFLQNASLTTYSNVNSIFIRNAKKRLEKGRK